VENTTGGYPPGATRFGAGRVTYAQSTTTFEVSRALGFFEETRAAAGAELRAERYAIDADPAPNVTQIVGFPGFGTAQATNHSRHDVAGYVDLESDVTSALMVGLAGRAEHYSDVGGVGAGKLSLRWEPVRKHALRASVERGFRVPSMAQMYFSNAATDEGFYVGSFLPKIDAPPPSAGLKPERSTTLSAGFVAEPSAALTASIDLYRVGVSDRIVIVDNQSPSTQLANAVDTRTNGLDVNVGYAVPSNGVGQCV
jgi:Outer membrane receptor for ferrienterochelin and colicins